MFEKILEWRAQQHPTRAAIWTESGEVSYGAFARDIARMTTALDMENLPPGVVLLGAFNPAFTWVLALALERLGRTTAIEPGLIDNAIEVIRPSVVITPDLNRSSIFGERLLHPSNDWRRQAFKREPSPRRSAANSEDVVRIVLSSGTTGIRKQVPITRRVSDVRIGRPLLGSPAPQIRFLQCQGADTLGGFQHPLTIWSSGGLMIIPQPITVDTFVTYKPNLMAASPIRLREILPLMNGVFSATDRVHIRVIGSALPPTLIREAMACQGVDLSVSYGSTEAGNIASGPASLAIGRPGAVGFVAPWINLQIVSDDGDILPPGESGVIRLRGEGVIEGYINAEPKAGASEDGWFYPNDLGHIDRDGVLVIDGRRDDVINVGGLKLSSARIEETILSCAGVSDAAVTVFPMSSGRWVIYAAIVAPDGYNPEAVRQKVLDVHAVGLELVDLPKIARNAMGKIQRSAVRAAILSIQTRRPG